MKKGLYLYCVRKKNPTFIKIEKTIDKGRAFLLSYGELEAVVSEVDLEKFSSEEIQKKAQEDVNWIKEKAQIHECVIEQAMRIKEKIVSVIPMRFGTIFKTKKSLEEVLKKNYSRFIKTLEKLKGKQEWGVKVYLNEEVFEKQLKDTSEVAEWTPRRWRKKSLPKGMDFFVKKQMEEAIKKEKNRKLNRVVKKVFENLAKLAVKTSQGKNLDQALTGRKEPMVLNVNYLVKEEKVEGFQKDVTELKGKYQNLGLIIQESGPWPPYNFVEK